MSTLDKSWEGHLHVTLHAKAALAAKGEGEGVSPIPLGGWGGGGSQSFHFLKSRSWSRSWSQSLKGLKSFSFMKLKPNLRLLRTNVRQWMSFHLRAGLTIEMPIDWGNTWSFCLISCSRDSLLPQRNNEWFNTRLTPFITEKLMWFVWCGSDHE